MFASELDLLSISGCKAGATIHLAIVDADYQYTECVLVMTADRWGEICVDHFGELLNDILKYRGGILGLFVQETGEWLHEAYIIPADCKPECPASEYCNKFPLSPIRGLKTFFPDFNLKLPLLMTAGTWTIDTEITYGGQQKLMAKKVLSCSETEAKTIELDFGQIFKEAGTNVPDYFYVKTNAKLTAAGSGTSKNISMAFRSVGRPYGRKSFSYQNAFGLEETMAIAYIKRNSKTERSIASVKGQKIVYDVADRTEYEIKSYPLSDGEEESAAEFLRSKKITDLETGIEYIVKDGSVKIGSAPDETVTMEAVIEQSGRMPKYESREKRIFDGTFDKSFE